MIKRYSDTPLALFHLIFDAVQVMLVLRFILSLLGANTANAFARIVYTLTEPLALPFRGIFPSTSFPGGVAEWSVLTAAIAYALLAILIVRLLGIVGSAVEEHDVREHHHA